MSTKAIEPAREETGKVTSVPELTVAANEEATGVTGEQPHDAAEGALRPTGAPQHQGKPGKQQPSTWRKSRRGILRKWLLGAAAVVGAGALLETNTGTAHADGTEGPTVFQTTDGRHANPLVKAVVSGDLFNSEESTAILCSGHIALNAYTNDITNPPFFPAFGQPEIAVVATSQLGYGVYASASSGNPAIFGTNSGSGTAVQATSTSGPAVYASSNLGSEAIYAESKRGIGVYAVGANPAPSSAPPEAGVFAQGGSFGYGVYATNSGGTGVFGRDYGSGNGVFGTSVSGTGVFAGTTSGNALVVNGPVKMVGHPVGQATIAAGSSSVTVSNPAATSSSNVLLTPLGNPNGSLWVTRANGSFTINASAAQGSNLPIAYLIIN